jgi:hypothetical protein
MTGMTHDGRPWPGNLEWGGDWLREAAAELAHLGFVLRDGSLPGRVPGPRLLVAFRERPTLEHFDPEEVTYWEIHDGRGRRAALAPRSQSGPSTPALELPLRKRFSWGRIKVTDRVPVSNQFLSFGGSLLVDRLDEHTVLAAFVSPAPMFRWAGHSQGLDPFVDEIGSFFARLMVPVDFQEGAEARIAAASAEALYAASIRFADARLNRIAALREADPALDAVVNHEVHRLKADSPIAWGEGGDLLDSLELA